MINRKYRDDPSTIGSERSQRLDRSRYTFKLIDYRVHTRQTTSADPPAAHELRVNHKKSWSFNLRLNLKIANFRVHLYGANQQANHR